MQCILESLEAQFPPSKSEIEVLVPKSNKGFASYDGVRVGAMKVIQEVRLFCLLLKHVSQEFGY